jgi:hypothetical protein
MFIYDLTLTGYLALTFQSPADAFAVKYIENYK